MALLDLQRVSTKSQNIKRKKKKEKLT